MQTALIGYSGFVGGNILLQKKFTDLYNSSNIRTIKGKSYDLLVCAGAPAEKWKANEQPKRDLDNINMLISCLSKSKAKKFILISTADVYPNPNKVDEDSKIDESLLQPYGKHRYLLEKFVTRNFFESFIIRLSGLFGKGLKKNFIYDLLNDHALDYTHKDSRFQYYSLEDIWKDIEVVLSKNIHLINFATEPVRASEVARNCFKINFFNVTQKNPVNYDLRSKHSSYFSSNKGYLYSKREIYKKLKKFIKNYDQNL